VNDNRASLIRNYVSIASVEISCRHGKINELERIATVLNFLKEYFLLDKSFNLKTPGIINFRIKQ
jgi:hypothetical protein